jgi:hypothetical protein
MRFLAASFAVLSGACWWSGAQTASSRAALSSSASVPKAGAQRFTYNVEWRSIHAGQVSVESRPGSAQMRLQSAGLVSKLYKVQDSYAVQYDDPWCVTSTVLDAVEGKRHRETRVTYDRVQSHAFYTERDLLKDAVVRTADVAIPNCVHDAVGAMAMLRRILIEPGTTIELPVSDGRKSAQVKVQAQAREEIQTPAGPFKTIRFEAELLNGVVYPRKGRVFLWLTDDARRWPVQIRLRMNFPIGAITLGLEKEESL